MKIFLSRRIALSANRPVTDMTKPRHLHPALLFLVIFVTYNLLGLINTPWTRTGAYDKNLPWELFLTGLIGFGIIVAIFGHSPPKIALRKLKPRKSIQLSILFFLVFTISLATAIALCGGIPLLQGEDRFSNSALAFNLAQLYGFWILVRIISDIEYGIKIKLIQPAIYLFGVVCFGYRTPILIFGIIILVYFITFRLSIKKSIVIGVASGLLIAGFAAVFSTFRVTQNYDLFLFFKNIDFHYVNDHPYLFPFVPALSMFDFSQSTVYKIGANLQNHMYGTLFISNYETFLPGRHFGARNIIGALTDARWVAGRPMSITPTLQGALFVDFGYIGVFLGFSLIALGISFISKRTHKWGALGKFSFCYFLTLSIMAIHNGYWDVGFVFFLFFLCIIRIFDALKSNFGAQRS